MNTNSAPLSATKDAEELSIEEAAGLVVKTVALQGFVDGAMPRAAREMMGTALTKGVR